MKITGRFKITAAWATSLLVAAIVAFMAVGGVLKPTVAQAAPVVGSFSCNDYAPYIYPTGCWGISESDYLDYVTRDIAQADWADDDEGTEVEGLLTVYRSSEDCVGIMYRYLGTVFHDFEATRFVWSSIGLIEEQVYRCGPHGPIVIGGPTGGGHVTCSSCH